MYPEITFAMTVYRNEIGHLSAPPFVKRPGVTGYYTINLLACQRFAVLRNFIIGGINYVLQTTALLWRISMYGQ